MNILVLGSEGMLGHVVSLYFKENGFVTKGTSRSGKSDYKFDASGDLRELDKIINEFNPEIIVNCIGILNKVAEENKSLAVKINSFLPHYLNELCVAKNIKFIHISTDCVFNGKGNGGYTENSFRDALDFYGRSKALGEVENDKNLTLRTSIVGPDINEGVGLFQWFMNQKDEVNGYDKAFWSGVTTLELAKSIHKAIDNELTGLRHVVNGQKIDKYSLLKLFKKYFNKEIEIHPNSDYVIDKSLIRETDFDFNTPSYEQMINEMADWVNNHEELYSINQRVKK